MKFGDMKREVNIKNGTAEWLFGKWTKQAFVNEGKEILKLHPEYQYVSTDPYIKNDKKFYMSVLCAYMADQILKEHPETQRQYEFGKWQEIHAEKQLNTHSGEEEKVYLSINYRFLCWYNDYLREQADPGCLAREQAQKDKELQESIELHRQIDAYYAAKHPRVECPYCHSMNTEKISGVARGVSIYVMGVASPKLGKQWHCNNCKSDF